MLIAMVDARKWFTGPKITINEEDLTEEQQATMREEGVHIEGVPAGSEGLEEDEGKHEQVQMKI